MKKKTGEGTLLERGLNALVHCLYQGAHQWPMERFQETALEALRGVIPFDSAMWGRGSGVPNALLDVYLFRQPRTMMDEYLAEYQALDFLADAVRAKPGVSCNLADLISREEFVSTSLYLGFARRWGIEQVLCTVLPDPVSSLYEVISLWRRNPKRPFSERERQLKESLMPHLVESRRINRLFFLRQRQPQGGQNCALGLANDSGILFDAEAGFYEVVRKEWPDWRGARLPSALVGTVGSPDGFVGKKAVLYASALGDMILLKARALTAADRLGEREKAVATRYGRGETYREIAQALGIAESTARNHLYRVFKKLRVRSKLGLAKVLDAAE
ncbi:MAG: helix-turn-helix transcriptional regulator [Gammaproteobacteria bacterium]|nr:helix-turn-helix transcriptional regulator [Gammaproteobacteria bacterium]